MFIIESSRFNYFKSPKDKEILDKAIPLIKEVFGYTDEELDGFKQKLFFPPLAMDITLEQAKLAIQPFWDNDISIWVAEYDENHTLVKSCIHSKKLGLVSQPPKSHYYDKPVIRRDQLIDPYNPPTWNSAWTTGFTFVNEPTNIAKSTIKCPYCQSTNTKKISGLSKAGSVALFGIFALGKTTKQWHCNDCDSDF